MRTVTTAIAILMVGTVLGNAGVAQTTAPREEAHIYNGTRGGSGTDETNTQDLVFTTFEGERLVHIRVDDTRNPNDDVVALTVTQGAHEYTVCGHTETPLAIDPGDDIQVRVESVGCDGLLGATTGQVQMFFFGTKKQAARWQSAKPPAPIYPDDINATTRTVDIEYQGGGLGAADLVFNPIIIGAQGATLFGATFMPYATERYASITITDDSGLPTRADISMENGPGPGISLGTICGKTDALIPVQPGRQILVSTSSGACADGTPAVATQGTISVTFYTPKRQGEER
jgi:hypothetical protein